MPPRPRRNAPSPQPTDASILWQAAFSRSGRNQQRAQWLKLDLRACMRTLQRHLRSGGHQQNGQRKQVSLQYVSTLFLGLCRIMSYQLSHTCANLTLPDLSRLLEQIEQSAKNRRNAVTGGGSNTFGHTQEQLLRKDPLVKAFMATSKQFERFHPMAESATTTVNNCPNLMSLRVGWPSEVPESTQADVQAVNQAEQYFEKLYDKMDSTDFLDECQDLLERYFGQKERRISSRFSINPQSLGSPYVNGNLTSNSSLPEPSDQMPDFNSEMPELTDPIIESSAPQVEESPSIISATVPMQGSKKRKSRKKRVIKKGKKKLFGLKRLVDIWKISKAGYGCLLQEEKDSKLTEPSRPLPSALKVYFKQGTQNEAVLCNNEQTPVSALAATPTRDASLMPENYSENYFENDDGNHPCGDPLETSLTEKVQEQSHEQFSSPPSPASPPQANPLIKLRRDEVVDLLNLTLSDAYSQTPSTSTTNNSSYRVPFASLLNSLPVEPTRQVAAQSFFTLLHFTAKQQQHQPSDTNCITPAHPSLSIELHQQPSMLATRTNGKRRDNKTLMAQFSEITVELKCEQ